MGVERVVRPCTPGGGRRCTRAEKEVYTGDLRGRVAQSAGGSWNCEGRARCTRRRSVYTWVTPPCTPQERYRKAEKGSRVHLKHLNEKRGLNKSGRINITKRLGESISSARCTRTANRKESVKMGSAERAEAVDVGVDGGEKKDLPASHFVRVPISAGEPDLWEADTETPGHLTVNDLSPDELPDLQSTPPVPDVWVEEAE